MMLIEFPIECACCNLVPRLALYPGQKNCTLKCIICSITAHSETVENCIFIWNEYNAASLNKE